MSRDHCTYSYNSGVESFDLSLGKEIAALYIFGMDRSGETSQTIALSWLNIIVCADI